MTTPQLPPLPEQSMTHHITDEQIDELCLSLTGTYTRKERDRAVARAVLALAAPAPAVPTGMLLVSADLIRRAQHAINWHLEPNSPDEHEATMRELAGLLTATLTPPAQSESPCACWPGRMCSRSAQCARDFQPAVPEDVAREPMTQRWCWWIGDAETFHIADTESEAHGEARCRIDDDCEPGDTREYSVGRVQHPIDALGVDWLSEHVAETIEENTREWCDDNTGAEDQSITLAAEDRKVLGTMVAAFLREKVSVHWWTADQKTITTHTYVAGSNDADAARKAGGAA